MKPMLACQGALDDPTLAFPLLVSPKIDGHRCLTMDWPDGDRRCVPVSRNLKPIRNDHIRKLLGDLPPGLDGELIAGHDMVSMPFHLTSSQISASYGEPAFTYCVFDYCDKWRDERWTKGIMTGYSTRLRQLAMILSTITAPFVKVVEQILVNDREELCAALAKHLCDGYEGSCARAPHSPYKFGRSTSREGWLIKFKTFVDSEAVVIGTEEAMHNANEHMPDTLTGPRRHTYKSGMVPMNKLGSLVARNANGVEFRIGTGFADSQRVQYWADRDSLVGRVVKFKHQPHGAYEKPRMPVFLGFRSDI